MATRRHGAALVSAIREAVLAEVAQHGYAATTYDGIAARAGTSKPVLYRRWPTKARMVVDALLTDHPAMAVPCDTGSLAGDLKALLGAVRASIETSGRRTMLSLLAEVDAESTPAVRELLSTTSAGVLEPLAVRARGRGDLGDSPLSSAVLTLPLDLLRHELLVVGTLSDDKIDEIVDQVAVPLLRLTGGRGDRGQP